MAVTKDSIKGWLDAYPDRDRYWLADKCGVEKRSVDNWLSSPREIPAKALLIIEGLMRADTELRRSQDPAPPQNLVLMVPGETFDAYNLAATRKGMIIREWAVEVLNEAAARDAARSPVKYPTAADERRKLSMVAEEPEEKQKPGA